MLWNISIVLCHLYITVRLLTSLPFEILIFVRSYFSCYRYLLRNNGIKWCIAVIYWWQVRYLLSNSNYLLQEIVINVIKFFIHTNIPISFFIPHPLNPISCTPDSSKFVDSIPSHPPLKIRAHHLRSERRALRFEAMFACWVLLKNVFWVRIDVAQIQFFKGKDFFYDIINGYVYWASIVIQWPSPKVKRNVYLTNMYIKILNYTWRMQASVKFPCKSKHAGPLILKMHSWKLNNAECWATIRTPLMMTWVSRPAIRIILPEFDTSIINSHHCLPSLHHTKHFLRASNYS